MGCFFTPHAPTLLSNFVAPNEGLISFLRNRIALPRGVFVWLRVAANSTIYYTTW